MSAVDTEPKWKVAFDAACARQRSNSAAQCEVFVEGVLQISGENYLSALALIGIRSPRVEEIAKLWVEHPAKKFDLKLQELEVVAILYAFCIAEGISVAVIKSQLIQISDVSVDTDVQVAVFGVY